MENKIRLDLHTHSSISYDGGISANGYRRLMQNDANFCLAITDHNQISLALDIKNEFGARIIVGEEILTAQGEIIGLYLNQLIKPGLSARETIDQIKTQGGLVYIPHPLEKTRKGLAMQTLQEIVAQIDIIEVFNARAKEPWLRSQVKKFAIDNNLAMAAASDAHGQSGIGTAYNIITSIPKRQNLLALLQEGRMREKHAALLSLFDPLVNKLKKTFHASK